MQAILFPLLFVELVVAVLLMLPGLAKQQIAFVQALEKSPLTQHARVLAYSLAILTGFALLSSISDIRHFSALLKSETGAHYRERAVEGERNASLATFVIFGVFVIWRTIQQTRAANSLEMKVYAMVSFAVQHTRHVTSGFLVCRRSKLKAQDRRLRSTCKRSKTWRSKLLP